MEKRLVKIGFILLIPLLFLQIPLRHKYKVEPYPTILLPAGATTVKDDGFITFVQTTVSAISASGKSYEISIHDLLNTVPRQYRLEIVGRSFGLPSGKHDQAKSSDPIAIAKGRTWLKNRLARILGEHELIKLEIRTYRVTKSTTDQTLAPEKTMLEKIEVPLHSTEA